MLNYYELIKLIGVNADNISTIQVLQESFNEDFRTAFDKISINKTTRNNAIKSYAGLSGLMADKEHSYLYGTGATIFYSTSVNFPAVWDDEKKQADFATPFLSLLKNQKPQDEYIKESGAVARALGWTPTGAKKYYIEIDGNTFDFSLVWSMFSMIADNNNKRGGCDVYTCDMDGRHKALLLKSKYGTAVILPFCNTKAPAFNVSFLNYIEHEKNIEKSMIDSVKGCA